MDEIQRKKPKPPSQSIHASSSDNFTSASNPYMQGASPSALQEEYPSGYPNHRADLKSELDNIFEIKLRNNNTLAQLYLETVQTRSFSEQGRIKAQRWSLTLGVTTVVLSTIITVLAGLKLNSLNQETSANITLILGGLVTLLNSVSVIGDFRKTTTRETLASLNLWNLRRDIRFYILGLQPNENIEPTKVEEFKDRLKAIVNQELADSLDMDKK